MVLKKAMLELLRRAATDLSCDVEKALEKGLAGEKDGSPAKSVMRTILENVRMARAESTPICQDTGSILFYIDFPEGESEKNYRQAIQDAVIEATNLQYLRPNAVDSLTAKNSGNNIGINSPHIHFHQWDNDDVRVRLMLKGGGSENVGAQYKLPHSPLKAGRDLNGVRKVIIDAVVNAQGQGCAPGIIGVGIGGTRELSYALSKEQFFREIGERNPKRELADLELQLIEDLNKLGIGPMGFGGQATVLDVFLGVQHRHPACFIVSVSYTCWAFRRKSLIIKKGEALYD